MNNSLCASESAPRFVRPVLRAPLLLGLTALLAGCGAGRVQAPASPANTPANGAPGAQASLLGQLVLKVNNIPDGANASIALKGRLGLVLPAAKAGSLKAASVGLTLSFSNLLPGRYTVVADKVKDTLGRSYNGAASVAEIEVRPGKVSQAEVTYNLAPFTVKGNQILDPDGKVFVARGANIPGRNFGWEDTDPITYANNITGEWKFNMVRASEYAKGNGCGKASPRPDWCKEYWGRMPKPEEHDALVNAMTSKGVVVMFEAHDWSGAYPSDEDVQTLIAYHKGLAERYKNNPYVWFNVYNEPGDLCQPASPRWYEVHKAVIAAIRAAGNHNIVVADGSNFGSERDCGQKTGPNPWEYDYHPKGKLAEEYSAILTYGPQLVKEFGNVVFSNHIYCGWTPTEPGSSFDYATDGEIALTDYVDRVFAKGLAIMFGEFGSNGGGNCDAVPAAKTMYKVARARNVGRLVWSWWGGDGGSANALVAGLDQGYKINSPVNPTNLTWLGKQVWDDTHNFDGTGSIYVKPKATAPAGALDRVGWTASATPGLPTTNPYNPGESIEAKNALDGELSYWATGGLPQTGTYFQVDLGAVKTFSGVYASLEGKDGDFADGVDVQISQDGAAWTTVAANVKQERGQPLLANVGAQSARYVRLVYSAPAPSSKWWVITEFYLTQ